MEEDDLNKFVSEVRIKETAIKQPKRAKKEKVDKSFWAVTILMAIAVAGCMLLFSDNWRLKQQAANNFSEKDKLHKLEKEKTKLQAEIDQLKAQQKEKVEAKTEVKALAEEAKAEVKAFTSEEKMKLATVGKGEGVEHVFIRQLIADPFSFGFLGENADACTIKKWAQKEAHKIAVNAGYFDWRFGGEIRIKEPDKVAYVLAKDAFGTSVEEYVKSDVGFSQHAQDIQKVTDSYAQAKFLAHEDEAGNFVTSSSHEYFAAPMQQ